MQQNPEPPRRKRSDIRDLAKLIEDVARDHFAFGPVADIIKNAVDHMCARARIEELNREIGDHMSWPGKLERRLQRIEHMLGAIIAGMNLHYKHEDEIEMATAYTLKRLQDDLRDNTDATQSTRLALEHYATSNAELTQQLQDAIAANEDEEVLKGIADQMEANNTALHAAAPDVAKAATDNTAAATDKQPG